VEVRRLEPDDWPMLREVRLRSLADTPEAFGSTHAHEAAFDEAEWRRRAGSNGWFVASDGEAPVGIVAGYREPTAPPWQRHLVAMWVAPDTRGRGLAARLVGAVVEWTRADGASELTLGVADGNEAARAAYLRYGFTPTGEAFPLHSDPSRNITIYRLAVERE
jgi:ribosomal protein S18 acetylase RimI-like enzyme